MVKRSRCDRVISCSAPRTPGVRCVPALTASSSSGSVQPAEMASRVLERMAVESRLRVTRQQILAFRRRVGALDERMPMGSRSLRGAAWAGLQDSMPRAALLSLHARVDGVESSTWEDPSLAQLWGPRYHTYV